MIPHKAFAAGDTLPALIRFSPLSKGVSVLSISIELKEYALVRWHGSESHSSRTVGSAKYDIIDGKAVRGSDRGRERPNPISNPSASSTAPPENESLPRLSSRPSSFKNLIGLGSLTSSSGPSSTDGAGPSHHNTTGEGSSEPRRAFGVSTMFGPSTMMLHSPFDTPAVSRRPSHENSSPEDAIPSTDQDESSDVPLSGDADVDTRISLLIPYSTTPSHFPPSSSASQTPSIASPLTVSHKAKFSVILSNLDGHTSELRCALPLHILDGHLLHEARAATRITRNILFGRDENAPSGDNVGEEDEDERDIPAELPSYNSHVLDRVANAEMDDGRGNNDGISRRRTNLASNPLLSSTSPSAPGTPYWTTVQSNGVGVNSAGGYFALTTTGSSGSPAPVSGWSSPLDGSGTPAYGPGAGNSIRQDRNPIEFDQELMLSLGEVVNSNSLSTSFAHGATGSTSPSPGPSRGGSRAASRVQSRASSPEPGDHHHHVYPSGNAGASRSGIFHLPKAFSGLSLSTLHPRGKMPPHNSGTTQTHRSHPTSRPSHSPEEGTAATSSSTSPSAASALENNPLNRVPSYGISSRGFLGGGAPPLQLYRDLPSYAQAEATSRANASDGGNIDRSRSEASLADMRRQASIGTSSSIHTP